ncbi:MAG: ABC transporter permease [Polyangiaceae bacterium]|jgi:peptide/nickel transport system permease protein|nr:ABC transporter permease [Polyangiaceae bacterium]
MLRRAFRRLASSLVVLWGVVTLAFVINFALPGDPARIVAGPQARPADVARIRQKLGLDRPLLEQYGRYLQRLIHPGPRSPDRRDEVHGSCGALGPLHVDLGVSYQQHRPVLELLLSRLPASLLLAAAAMLVQLAVGLVTGTAAAVRRGTLADKGVVALTLLGVSAPTFLLGLGLQYLFAYRLRWLPFDGYGQSSGERLLSVVLPALTLGLFGAAYYTRLVRDEVLGQLGQDYARTALAKGASRLRVLVVHVLRNTLLPLVTVVGLDFGTLLGGAIVTEKLFRWPGLGQLSVDAVVERDGPVILGTVLVASTAVLAANLLVDLSYALLDPRSRGRGG